MHGDGNVGQADGRFNEFLQVDRIGVAASAFGDLEDDRRLFRFTGFHDGLEQFHIVDVKGPKRVLAFEGLGEQISGMCQWHKFGFRFGQSMNRSVRRSQGPAAKPGTGDRRGHKKP